MPIEGPVHELAVSDLLQLLHLSRRTGKLNVSGGGPTFTLQISEGALTGASGGASEMRLGRLLVRAGRATETQVGRALERQRRTPGRVLGEFLVEDDQVSSEEIERQLRFQIEEAVFQLMRREEGHLQFVEEDVPVRRAVEVRMGTDAVLMNAARRIDEFMEVTSGVAGADPLPRLASPQGFAAATLALEPLEWEVLAEVDGRRTLRAIARVLGYGELEVARALFSLAEAGVVEVGGRSPADAAATPDVDAYQAADSAIVEGRLADAERILRLLPSGDATAAERRLLEARVRIARGDWSGAVGVLDSAIALQPSLSSAYYHLARASLRLGDLRRAGAALQHYVRLHDDDITRRESAARMDQALKGLLAAMEEGTP